MVEAQRSKLKWRTRLLAACLVVCGVLRASVSSASGFGGSVTIGGVPVPGALVTAVRDQATQTTTSDFAGRFSFPDLADGEWSLRVEMPGFAPSQQTVTVGAGAAPAVVALTLLEFSSIGATVVAAPAAPPRAASAPARAPAGRTAAARPPSAGAPPDRSAAAAPRPAPAENGGEAAAASAAAAADGLLINGSVNNGAASPFAQLAAFGNNRRNVRSLYNGGLGVVFGTSAWDARPYSFGGAPTLKPSYSDTQMMGTFGGPVRIPGVRNRATVYAGFQQLLTHNTSTQSALVPTVAERQGDFSNSVGAGGQPLVLIDPATGAPFKGNTIPSDRLSPQALALLQYYPRPNVNATGFNLQGPTLNQVHQRGVQARISQSLTNRDVIFGNVAYQRVQSDATSLFRFTDGVRTSNAEAVANWSHRFSPFFTVRGRYTFSTQNSLTTPFFAGRTNVSGEAGITGNNQEPLNWGPPGLLFSSGVAGLGNPQAAKSGTATHGWSVEGIRTVGRHTMTIGGAWIPQHADLLGQQDARGSFGFTGAITGSDVADFMLGLPATSGIAVGNPDKSLIGHLMNAYMNDDWRVSSALTVNAGVRWEYESPMHEREGRLANIALAGDFSTAAVTTGVEADAAGGSGALVSADARGIEPRLGVAWRPVPGSSLVVRGGYGVYRNTNVYQTLATLLAQQPPFSKAYNIASPQYPLTLANGFPSVSDALTNTFAIDPAFRVGYAHTWQASVQRDLPGSTTVSGSYLGTRGVHLMQELLPNTYAPGAVNPCPACPAGYVYLTSNADSLRNAGQVQLRRRLRNGLTASAQYTLAKATDNASAFVPSGVDAASTGIAGATVAQDWLDLDAEHARSSFDQRHLLVAEVQYTTGQGVAGGALLDGKRGQWLKGWTLTSQLTVGSGLPVTPRYLSAVAGTGVIGTIRGSVVGDTNAVPDGYYANPAAYAPPSGGEWGTAPRNSISGPAQFGMNASLGRSFTWGQRNSLDWRLEATNVLNHVTYSGINSVVGSPQFGLANRANVMRKLQMSARYRF